MGMSDDVVMWAFGGMAILMTIPMFLESDPLRRSINGLAMMQYVTICFVLQRTKK